MKSNKYALKFNILFIIYIFIYNIIYIFIYNILFIILLRMNLFVTLYLQSRFN